MARKLIAEKQIGTRTLCGTDWPVVDQLHREQRNSRVRWVITRRLCNGVPDGATIYPTRREAASAW